MYVDVTRSPIDSLALLSAGIIRPSQTPSENIYCVDFWYHMDGENIGVLGFSSYNISEGLGSIKSSWAKRGEVDWQIL